jgi:predicted metal-binding membrane protein
VSAVSDRGLTAVSAWRARAFIWAALAAVVGLSWLYLVRMNNGMAAMMPDMAHHAMPAPSVIGALPPAFLMWSIMMVAMMVPTTVHTLSLFMALSAKRSPGRPLTLATFSFVGGYVAAWAGYSLLAAVAQVALARAAFLTPMLRSTSVVLSAAILLAAGLFQFTALKEACLAKCRTPLGFFLAEWRDGAAGAFAMGLQHGSFCVVCCWALMAVMLVVGAMNLLWMAALTAFMLAEKLVPARWQVSRLAGAAFVLWGLFVLVAFLR